MKLNDNITHSLAEAVKQVTEKKKLKTETEVQKANKDFVDLHAVDKKKDPEKEKQVESKKEVEEGNEFTKAAAEAKLAGKDEFEFEGKTYPVEIGQDAAEKILGKNEETELEEADLELDEGITWVVFDPKTKKEKRVKTWKGAKAAAAKIDNALIHDLDWWVDHKAEILKSLNEHASELEEAAGFPESSQGAKQTYDAVVKLSASLRKGSQLNKAVNKRLGGKYDSDFVKMQKAITVIFDTLEEFDREYQGFDN